MSPLALFNGSFLGNKPTGIGVVARDLIRSLDPDIVSLLDPLGGKRLGSIPIPGNLMPEYGLKAHVRRLVWTQTKLPSLLKRSGAEFLLSPVPEAPLLRGVKSVVMAHDLLPLRHPQITPLLAYHLTYVPLVLHRSIRILCNSQATAKELHDRLGISIRKLSIIPLGFNSENIYPLNLQRKRFFLVLGRHDPHKNIFRVLKALSLISDSSIGLWFVGPEDQRYTPRLKKAAKELGVAHRCKWISWVNDMDRLRLLNSCTGLVIASLWEGFGLPALEAMACETPVIASNRGALPEVVSNAGLLINPNEPNEIAEAMMQILSNNTLRNTLIENGRKRINFYKWENAAEIIEGILQDL